MNGAKRIIAASALAGTVLGGVAVMAAPASASVTSSYHQDVRVCRDFAAWSHTLSARERAVEMRELVADSRTADTFLREDVRDLSRHPGSPAWRRYVRIDCATLNGSGL